MNTKNRNQFLIEHITKLCVVFFLFLSVGVERLNKNSSLFGDFSFIMAIIFFAVLILFSIIKFFKKWYNIRLNDLPEFRFFNKVYNVLFITILFLNVGKIPEYFGFSYDFVTTITLGFFTTAYFVEFYRKYKFGKSNNFQ